MICGIRSAAKLARIQEELDRRELYIFKFELHVYTHTLLPSIKKRQKGMNAKADDDCGWIKSHIKDLNS